MIMTVFRELRHGRKRYRVRFRLELNCLKSNQTYSAYSLLEIHAITE